MKYSMTLLRSAGALLVGTTALVINVPRPAEAAPAPIAVPTDMPTIQAAIDAAGPGGIVVVAAGTYVEELVIDADVTLVGAGQDRTFIAAPASLTPYGVHLPDGRDLTAVVRVGNGADAVVSGITVRGPIPCAVEVSGINVFDGASLDLGASRVTDIQADPTTCGAEDGAGRGIVYGLPSHIEAGGERGSSAYGRVRGVTVDHYQHVGITVTGPDAGPASHVELVGNRVTGGWTLPSFQYGIQVVGGAGARIVRNEITGNRCGGPGCGPDPMTEMQGAGVLVVAATQFIDVVDNRVDANDVGLYQVVSAECCRLARNRLTDNAFFGIVIQDNDGGTESNVISGGAVGIGVVADFVDVTAVLRGDRISATSVAPVQELECCGFIATATVTRRGLGHR
jgi:hypothetical protein